MASLGLDIVVQDLTIGTMDYAIFGRGRVVARRLAIASGRENAVLAERDIDLRDVVMDGEWVIRSGRNLRNVTSGPGFWGDTASLIAADRRLRLVHADVVSVESGRKPRLVHTTCERSTVAGAPGVSWGVCALDP